MTAEQPLAVGWPTLAARAKVVMGEHDSGTRRVAWAELTKLSTGDVQSFQDALIAEAARLRLEVRVYSVQNAAFDGIEIRWRPAR